MTLPFHPIAKIFPTMTAEEHAELVASMRQNGFMVGEEIVMLDGAILDGRNRYGAAIEAGIFDADVDPKTRWEFVEFSADGMDGVFTREQVVRGPLEFVVAKNLSRRHLSDDQRRMVAARLADMGRGRPGENPANGGISIPQAAATLNVDEAGVERARAVVTKGAAELQEAVDQGGVSVRAAADIARLAPDEQAAVLTSLPRDDKGKLTPDARRKVLELAKEIRGGDINGARALMGSRREPDDSLDYFPTPPWATRALLEHVLPRIGVPRIGAAWEPACGEGHIAEVLTEYCDIVHATDVFDYGYGEVSDFLLIDPSRTGPEPRARDGSIDADAIITNPPFGDRAIPFVLKALDLAPCVAMFMRSQWASEGVLRYEQIFRDRPPTLLAFFTERVNLCKGRWEPDGSTATAYCWLVWNKGRAPLPPFWIPPVCRAELTRADDVERFTAHPVVKRAEQQIRNSDAQSQQLSRGPALPPPRHDDIDLTIPAFLRRTEAA